MRTPDIAPVSAGRDDADAASQPYHMVRGLERGLVVLRALNRLGEASSLQIAKQVGLPRPTVHRLLETLRALGFVDRSRLRDLYHLTSSVRQLSDGYRSIDGVLEVATPILHALSRQLVWPVNIATYEKEAMVFRVNTHRDSPLSLVTALPGTRVPMLETALGRTYLAFCEDAERGWILEALEASGRHVERRDLDPLMAHIREAGYAVSEGGICEQAAALAVPVMSGGRVAACMNVMWMRSVMGPKQAIERFLPALRAAAASIGEALEDRRERG